MDNLSPVLRKLSGIAGRRRMEDEEFQDEAPLLDLSGLRPPPTNDYIPDPINGGTIPERYDVRANSVMMPVGNMQQQQPEMLSAGVSGEGLGEALSSYFSPDPEHENSLGGMFGKLGSAFKSWMQPGEDLRPLVANAGLYAKSNPEAIGVAPEAAQRFQDKGIDIPQTAIEQEPRIMPAYEQDPNIQRNAEIDVSEPSPDRAEVIYGATNKVANSPELKNQLE